ncbi:hypothetical protein QWA68_008869, partial [Fusarium oxysporum]
QYLYFGNVSAAFTTNNTCTRCLARSLITISPSTSYAPPRKRPTPIERSIFKYMRR